MNSFSEWMLTVLISGILGVLLGATFADRGTLQDCEKMGKSTPNGHLIECKRILKEGINK